MDREPGLAVREVTRRPCSRSGAQVEDGRGNDWKIADNKSNTTLHSQSDVRGRKVRAAVKTDLDKRDNDHLRAV